MPSTQGATVQPSPSPISTPSMSPAFTPTTHPVIPTTPGVTLAPSPLSMPIKVPQDFVSYVGCFLDDFRTETSLLLGTNLDPAVCDYQCHVAGGLYIGLGPGNECHCYSILELNREPVAEELCDIPCAINPVNSKLFCEGSETKSVYQTTSKYNQLEEGEAFSGGVNCFPDGYSCSQTFEVDAAGNTIASSLGPSCVYCCTNSLPGVGGSFNSCGESKTSAPYLGCYDARSIYFEGARELGQGAGFRRSFGFDRDSCQAECFQSDLPLEERGGIFGLTAGGLCYCGLVAPQVRVADSECDARCDSDPTQSCGNGSFDATSFEGLSDFQLLIGAFLGLDGTPSRMTVYSLRQLPNQQLADCRFWAARLREDEDKSAALAALNAFYKSGPSMDLLKRCFENDPQIPDAMPAQRDSGIWFQSNVGGGSFIVGGAVGGGIAVDVDTAEARGFNVACVSAGFQFGGSATFATGFLFDGSFDDFAGWGLDLTGTVVVGAGVTLTTGVTLSGKPFSAIGASTGAELSVAFGGCNTNYF
ncbi:WSC domain containing protein [Nitzschia inconspicua]|uniref:WSC domain containing protein n=1 Tax=Nitzschia inconspicua TaxID=303405 RepID=A0A9K3M7Z3_9STRA|nr:WSC domain containing protein [Nitzschia inconspicua]